MKSLPDALAGARFVEVTILTGFVMISLPFVSDPRAGSLWKSGPILFLATLCLFTSIYALNGYFGYAADRSNPRLNGGQYDSPASYLALGAGTLLLSLPLFFALGPLLPAIAALIYLLWFLYSVPGGAKSKPLWGTVVHFVAQVLHFNLGIMAFGRPTAAAEAISVFFALLFSSGHLMHELKDYEPDRASSIQTNAVALGPERLGELYRAMTVGTAVYWIALRGAGILPARLFLPFFLASAVHVLVSFTWKNRSLLDPAENQRFQAIYRLLYLAAGVAAFAA